MKVALLTTDNREDYKDHGAAALRMDGPPKISVVTPSFDSVSTIAGTLQSVLSQDYTNWEHIVVDGDSTDGTVAVLKSYPRLTWVSEKDEGHYHAMNKGIARATGDVVVILNADRSEEHT